MGTTLLSDLEQAELTSRARLLAAEAEADGRLEAAVTAAARIEAGTGQEIDRAIAALRDHYRAQTERDVAAAEAELSQLEQATATDANPTAAFDVAVASIVAAVLGETRV